MAMMFEGVKLGEKKMKIADGNQTSAKVTIVKMKNEKTHMGKRSLAKLETNSSASEMKAAISDEATWLVMARSLKK